MSATTCKQSIADHCTFVYPGTYGHECGEPSVFVGIKQSKYMRDGIYFAGRCAKCREIKGFENTGLTFEPFDANKHINHW